MTTVIVHDYLTQCGGAERVVLQLTRMFPDAPVYTSIYSPDRTFEEFADRVVCTSRLQGRVRPERFRAAVLRYPGAFRAFDLASFDTVVVSSSAFAHHVVHPRSFVYCHTPPRFLYDPATYGRGRGGAALVAAPALAALRWRDRRAALRHRSYAANSTATAQRVLRAYGRLAEVIPPPLWSAHLPALAAPAPAQPRALVVSRLLPYKRVDVAVAACALAGVGLTVVGHGPHERRLRAEARGDVRFAGRVGDDELAELFASHSVVLAPGREDFGYLPVEANYAGRPVVALAAGGALETVVDGVTGVLVEGHDPARWAAAVRAVHQRAWSPEELRASTGRFQAPAFEAAVRRWLAGEPAQP